MPTEPIRYAAFMRAINVGKRRVKMAELVRHVESLGFDDVQTLIASGNVAFTDPFGRSAEQVAEAFDTGVSELLGFDVVSVFRTADEVAAVVAAQPLGSPDDDDWSPDDVVHVSFLFGDPPPEAHERFAALSSADDRFAIVGRELYWRRRGKLTDSVVDAKTLARALGVEATARRLDTVAKMEALLR